MCHLYECYDCVRFLEFSHRTFADGRDYETIPRVVLLHQIPCSECHDHGVRFSVRSLISELTDPPPLSR